MVAQKAQLWRVLLALAAWSAESEEERRFKAETHDPELAFRRYFDQIYRYCRQRVTTDTVAEDICAQVFAEAIVALPRLRWRGKPVLAFLYKVTERRLIDYRRRRRQLVDIESVAEPAQSGPALDVLAQHGALGEEIAALPADQRQCVYLQVVQGYSFAEVAAIVGRSEKACKGLVYRGLDRLREQLAGRGVGPA